MSYFELTKVILSSGNPLMLILLPLAIVIDVLLFLSLEPLRQGDINTAVLLRAIIAVSVTIRVNDLKEFLP